MANYFYTAKSAEGKTVKGSMQAKDLKELYELLKNQNLILVKGQEARGGLANREISFNILGVSAAEKIVMVKNLSVMAGTGLSLVNSFSILINQTKNSKLKKALIGVQQKINKGESMSSAMAAFPDIFSDFFLSMVQVGEESGTLEEVFKILALQVEKEHRLKSQIRGAMIYPSVILLLMIVVAGVIVKFVLPNLSQFFESLEAEIPFYTRMLIGFGKFSEKNWPLLVASPIVMAGLIWLGLKTKTGKWLKDTILLKIPALSSFIKQADCAVLIRSLSSLLGSGVPLVRSLEVAEGTVGNFYFKKALREAQEKIKKGKKMSEALADHKNIFPFGVIEMMQVGEETGKTSSILKTLADFYENEVSDATAKLSSIIEPVLLIVLGLMVGFFAFSIIQPIYSSLSIISSS